MMLRWARKSCPSVIYTKYFCAYRQYLKSEGERSSRPFLLDVMCNAGLQSIYFWRKFDADTSLFQWKSLSLYCRTEVTVQYLFWSSTAVVSCYIFCAARRGLEGSGMEWRVEWSGVRWSGIEGVGHIRHFDYVPSCAAVSLPAFGVRLLCDKHEQVHAAVVVP